MTFIIMLISLIIERFFHWSHLRSWRWFAKYHQWLSSTPFANKSSVILLVICILPLLIIVGLINHLLSGWFYGIPQLIFGVLVLLYCMGPQNLWVQAYSCLSEINREDPKVAVDRAQVLFGIPSPGNSKSFHQSLTSAIFIAAHERIFAVVFWFVILGPVGAVLYRAVSLCTEQSDLGLMSTAAKFKNVLDWLPARLFAFIFALGGHFKDVFHIWKQDIKAGLNGNKKLISDCGIAAIDGKAQNNLPENGEAEKSALELLDRVFVMGLVFLAVIVLIMR
jgi:AmpE protein